MKKVTSADSLVLISHYKNLLESEGIEAFIRNEHLGSILGEMPFQEVWPEVWVRNDLMRPFVNYIHVMPGNRRRGVATAMVRAMIEKWPGKPPVLKPHTAAGRALIESFG